MSVSKFFGRRKEISKIITTLSILAIVLIGVGLTATVSLGIFQPVSKMPYVKVEDMTLTTDTLYASILNPDNAGSYSWTHSNSITAGKTYALVFTVSFIDRTVKTYSIQVTAS